MSELVVYKSAIPIVLRAWEQATSDYTDWSTGIFTFAKDVHPDAKPIVGSAWGDDRLMGLSVVDPLPDGWRVVKSRRGHDFMIPKQNTKVGKTANVMFEAVRKAPQVLSMLPGMPSVVFAKGSSYTPGTLTMDGVLYVSWGCDPNDSDLGFSKVDKVDTDLWERVKLSEYYAAKEANESVPA